MRRLSFILITFCLCYTSAFAQHVRFDKTDRYGRLIATDYGEIYELQGREGYIALTFFLTEEASSYCLTFKTQEDFNIRVGDKMLLKHENGNYTELECVENGDKKTHVSSFGMDWLKPFPEFYRSTDGVLYSITEDQIKAIIDSPVIQIRIEEELKYSDRKVTSARGKSHLSNAVETAFNGIQESLLTKKTGLYDNF